MEVESNREGNKENSSLPMTVWLRGHEDFFSAFSLDAEQAMEFLGIKRTRLSQISGRELRVGKIKDGRLIRNLYRLQDLEDYQSWVRMPVTKQKTKDELESVKDQIDELFSQLGFKIENDRHEAIRQTGREGQQILSSVLASLEYFSEKQLLSLARAEAKILSKVLEEQKKSQEEWKTQFGELAQSLDRDFGEKSAALERSLIETLHQVQTENRKELESSLVARLQEQGQEWQKLVQELKTFFTEQMETIQETTLEKVALDWQKEQEKTVHQLSQAIQGIEKEISNKRKPARQKPAFRSKVFT